MELALGVLVLGVVTAVVLGVCGWALCTAAAQAEAAAVDAERQRQRLRVIAGGKVEW